MKNETNPEKEKEIIPQSKPSKMVPPPPDFEPKPEKNIPYQPTPEILPIPNPDIGPTTKKLLKFIITFFSKFDK